METILRETINLDKIIEIEGVTVARMSGQLFSDVNNELNYSVAISNYDLYLENLEECRKEIEEFYELLMEREDYMIERYHTDELDDPVEDEVDELPVEDVPEDELPEA